MTVPAGHRPTNTRVKTRPATLADYDASLSAIYQAATDPKSWGKVIPHLIRFVGNSGAHFFFTDPATGLVSQDAYVGMPEMLMADYNTGLILSCPRMKAAREHPDRIIVYDYQHIDEKGIDRSEYYRWLQTRGDGIRYYLGLRLGGESSGFCGISFAFRKSEGHCQREHIERLQRIAPHLQRAVDISRQLGANSFAAHALDVTLKQMQGAIVLLDARGSIVYVSAAADAMVSGGAWLRLGPSGMRLANSAANRSFQHQVALCIALSSGRCQGQPTHLDVTVTDDACYRLSPAPLMMREACVGSARPCVLVSIVRMAASAVVSDAMLAGLTPAERRLANALADGQTVSMYVREQGISIHTARAQLKSIFLKTGTHRQGEFISKVLRARAATAT